MKLGDEGNMEKLSSENSIKRERKVMYALMSLVIILWGIGFPVVKFTLETLDPLSILFYRYLIVFWILLIYKKIKIGGGLIKKEDLPLYIVCAIVGDLIYFYSEYTAMDYLPVSLLSIIITLTPMLSVVTERVLYKKKTSLKAIVGIIICVVGVALIIGVDFEILLQGRLFGYILAFVCVFTFNVWNFMTASLHEKYDTITLMLNQMLCAIILLLPHAIYNLPEAAEVTSALIWQMVFLAVINSGFSFFVTVRALHVLGPTTTTLFANFLPVTTTIFGWLLLNETISPLQIIGGIIVILAGYIVIKEKGKSERIVFNKK